MTIGNRIAHLRGKTSRRAFAEQIGIVENTLRNYEQDLSLPNSDVIATICKTLFVSFEWLIVGTGPMRPGEAPQTLELQANAPEMPPEAAAGACPRCAKLEEKLERLEEERREKDKELRELSAENRQLWKENKELSARNATLEERQKTCCPENLFKTTQAIPPSNEELRA